MEDDSYEEFYLGEVRVVQANASAFLVYGESVPGGVWIYRGQVHLDSLLDADVGAGAKGRLTVTKWWAMTRGLKEAPRRERWRKTASDHFANGGNRERQSVPMPRREGQEKPASSTSPPGFTKR